MINISSFNTNTVIEPAKELNVKLHCDVLVAGGGTCGTIAAIAAARHGANVVLVEKYGELGGTMINGAVSIHSFFSAYYEENDPHAKQIIKGIGGELFDRIVKAGGTSGHIPVTEGACYDPYFSTFDSVVAKGVMSEMVTEAGVKVLLHTTITDVIMNEKAVAGVVVESVSGREAILCKVCIDCSGDGVVAAPAGVPGGELYSKYAAGYTFGLSNIDFSKLTKYLDDNNLWIQKAYGKRADGSEGYVRMSFMLGDIPPISLESPKHDPATHDKSLTPKFGKKPGCSMTSLYEGTANYINFFGFGFKGLNPTDVEDLTLAEMEMKRDLIKIGDYFRKYVPGCEHCYVSYTARSVCPRASRVFKTEYELSNDEIFAGKRFEDEIGYTGFHDLASDEHRIGNGGYTGIPYRIMVPLEIENLLVAGKIISSDAKVHQCTRIGGACLVMGEAAGTAAALCLKENSTPRTVNIQSLKLTLKNAGQYIEL